jgi:curved DNA-binding protein CbpA
MAAAIMNPYKVLGVGENATQDEIKDAFRRLSKELHPDTGNEGSQEFINIRKAYEILSHRQKRDTFDLYGVVVDFAEEARKIAFQVFLDVALRCPAGFPLDTEIKSFITLALIPKYEEEMKASEERKSLLESRLSGIVSKPDDEDDFITERTWKVIEECERSYRMALLKRDLHKAALELLQKYKFNLEQIENGESPVASENGFGIPEIEMLGVLGDGVFLKNRKRRATQ